MELPDGHYFVQHAREGAGYTLPEGIYFVRFVKNTTFFTADSGGPFEGLVFRFYDPKILPDGFKIKEND